MFEGLHQFNANPLFGPFNQQQQEAGAVPQSPPMPALPSVAQSPGKRFVAPPAPRPAAFPAL